MTRRRFASQSFQLRAYVTAVVVAGATVISLAIYDISYSHLNWRWTIFALLTLLSGSASVSLPASASVSISETFVFSSAILFGPAVGTVIVALDAAVISFWSYRRGQAAYKIVFNICALPLAIWLGSSLFFAIADVSPLYGAGAIRVTELLAPLFIFTVVYFTINSWLITFAIALEKRLPPYPIWRDTFARLSVNYFAGASIAALFVGYSNSLDIGFFALAVPLLVVVYFVFSTSSERVKDASRHLTELNNLYLSTIETLAMAIDAKDQITHGHIRRVQSFATGLAKRLGVKEDSLIKAIEAAALLHDMGKLAVPEYILNKPGPLTPAEFSKMKLHASVGADILSSVNFPYPVVPIVRHHHENWDGTGYPDGLRGTDIPIGARILSVVDCFDALTSDRPYRPKLTDAAALQILTERRGSMYDPLVVDAFIGSYRELLLSDTAKFQIRPSRPLLPGKDTPAQEASVAGLNGISASSEESLVLYEMASALVDKPSAVEMVESAVRMMWRLVPPCTCVVYTLDSNSDELCATVALGREESLFRHLRIPRGQRLSGWVAANLQTIVNSDPVLELGPQARSVPLRSCLSTPMTFNDALVGVLALYSPDAAAFDEDHRRVAEAAAKHLGQALHHALRFGGQEIVASGSSREPGDRRALVIINLASARQHDDAAKFTNSDFDGVIALLGVVGGREAVPVRFDLDRFILLLPSANPEVVQTVIGQLTQAVSGPTDVGRLLRLATVTWSVLDGSGMNLEDAVRSASGFRALDQASRAITKPKSVH